MVGLDAAGKTTILYKLKLGEIVTTIPTIGKHDSTIVCIEATVLNWSVVVGRNHHSGPGINTTIGVRDQFHLGG